MFEKVVTKLWRGDRVSVRDYEVENAIAMGGMVIVHGDEAMKLMPEELKDLKPSQKVQSKYSGSYNLIDIFWRPSKDKDQMDLGI